MSFCILYPNYTTLSEKRKNFTPLDVLQYTKRRGLNFDCKVPLAFNVCSTKLQISSREHFLEKWTNIQRVLQATKFFAFTSAKSS
jgi:hypothetical protein